MEKKPKDEIREELKSLSPFLSKMKEENAADGFSVPKNYFHNLRVEMLQQAKAEMEQEVAPPAKKSTIWGWFYRPQFRLAMGVGLVLLVSWLVMRSYQNTGVEAGMASLTYEEMNTYVQENLDEFDEDLLADYAAANSPDDWSFLSGEEVNQDDVDAIYEELLDDVDLSTLEELL